MHTAAQESLLDESDFLAELSTLEQGLPHKQPSASSVFEMAVPVRLSPPRTSIDEPRPEPPTASEDDDSPVLGKLASVGMFVLMMSVGAAGAALLYHERVARILASLRI